MGGGERRKMRGGEIRKWPAQQSERRELYQLFESEFESQLYLHRGCMWRVREEGGIRRRGRRA